MPNIKLSVLTSNNPESYCKVCAFIKSNYKTRLKVTLESFPEVILVATNSRHEIVGALGINSGRNNKQLLLESYFEFDILEKLTGLTKNNRDIAEIGSLSIESSYANNYKLTIILTASMALWAKKHNYQWIVLTTLPKIQNIAKPLNIISTIIGCPDISCKPQAFQDNWQYYFSLKASSVGFNVVNAAPGCLEYLNSQEVVDFQEIL